MRPIEIAKKLYVEHHSRKRFEEVLASLINSPCGLVISTPLIFVMAYTSIHKGEPTWVVDTAVGRLSTLISVMPFPLTYIAFMRGKQEEKARIKYYRLERFMRLVK